MQGRAARANTRIAGKSFATDRRLIDRGRHSTVDCLDLIPSQKHGQLLANGARAARGENHDPHPVVRLFTPDANASWLLTELDPDDEDLAYGLCDVGLGTPRLGYIRLSDLAELVGGAIQCDRGFVARQALSAYLRQAQAAGTIQP